MSKQLQRQRAYAARNAQLGKDAVSAEICGKLLAQSWYQAAQTVLWYVHCRSEVRTLTVLSRELYGGKHLVVPYCTEIEGIKQLGLWRLNDVDELQPGMWNILEPPRERWLETGKLCAIEELDVVVTPGVGFDRQGGRLGNGAGYYDRLLSQVRDDAIMAAVCYESQLLPEIEMEPHDVYMDYVITENAVYQGRRRLLR